MKFLLTTTAIISASVAAADGINYGRLSYDYTNFSDGTNDVDISVLQGSVEYQVSQFQVYADLTSTAVDNGGSFDFQEYAFGAGYLATPEVLLGAGILGFSTDGFDSNGYELFGQYQTAQFGLGLNVSVPDADFDDETLTQAFGEFTATPAVKLGVALEKYSEEDATLYTLSADYDEGPITARTYINSDSETDGGIFGVRGSYEITQTFRASVSYNTTYGDDLFDISFMGIGGGYRIADGVWFDADFGQISSDLGPEDIDRIQATITLETGEQTRIDRRFLQDSVDDIQAGFASVFFF